MGELGYLKARFNSVTLVPSLPSFCQSLEHFVSCQSQTTLLTTQLAVMSRPTTPTGQMSRDMRDVKKREEQLAASRGSVSTNLSPGLLAQIQLVAQGGKGGTEAKSRALGMMQGLPKHAQNEARQRITAAENSAHRKAHAQQKKNYAKRNNASAR